MTISTTIDFSASGERRQRERRVDMKRSFLGQFYRARRAVDRRQRIAGDMYYVDRHEPWLVGVVALTLVLCVADIINTLILIMHGGSEVNPLMAILIDKDTWLFVYVKFGLTAVCLLILLMHKQYQFLGLIRGYHIIISCLIIYVLLILYQIKLMSLIPGPLLTVVAHW